MILRVLGALPLRGAIWSGKVISSSSSPSGGPFMTHFLHGGGVPWVHEIRSPVPLRLLHFATPLSVCHLATVVAGAYPPRLPPNAWSPGVPALLALCYWLVASGTPTGWRGGYLAAELVRSTVCYYCLGGCTALVLCARRSRQVPGVGAGAGSRVSPLPSLPSPALFTVHVAGRPVRVFLPLTCRYAIRCVLCVPRAQLSRPSGPRCLPAACICTRAPAALAPLPRVSVARGPRAVAGLW